MFTHLSILECVPIYGKLSLILNITTLTDITSFRECSPSLWTSTVVFEQVWQALRHFGRRATYHPHIRWGRWATHLENFLNRDNGPHRSCKKIWGIVRNHRIFCTIASGSNWGHIDSSWVSGLDFPGRVSRSLLVVPCRFLHLSHHAERPSWRLPGWAPSS